MLRLELKRVRLSEYENLAEVLCKIGGMMLKMTSDVEVAQMA
jgi:hypothetical protein